MSKRFTKYMPDSYNYTSIITIVDNKTGKQSASVDDFVDLLNELAEENEQLKQENEELQQKNKEWIKYVHQLEIALKKGGH